MPRKTDCRPEAIPAGIAKSVTIRQASGANSCGYAYETVAREATKV